MNLKFLAVTTLLLTLGSVISAFSADNKGLSTLFRTRQCVDCNLSNIIYPGIKSQDLRNANLQGSNLLSSFFEGSDLRNANLSNTNSKHTNFGGVDLRNANFSNADVSGANFCSADLRGVNWTSIIYNKETKCLPNEAVNYVSTANNLIN